MTSQELRAKRANLHEQYKAILAKPAAERGAEDAQALDRMDNEFTALDKEIERVERSEAREKELNESRGTQTRETATEKPEGRAAERDAAFLAWLRGGAQVLSDEQRKLIGVGKHELGTQVVINLRSEHERRVMREREQRAPQTVTTTAGGYLIPVGFSGMLEESLKAYGGVEQVADIFETETGNTLDWPTVNDNSNSGRLLAINTAATETALVYAQTQFAAYKFSSDMVTVPVELMQDSAFGIDAHVAHMLGVRLGRVHNTYQTTGTGSSQPQGIATGAVSGVTAASATEVTADELFDLIHSVDPAYRNPMFGPGFMFNDTTLKELRKLKDGEGRYLWQAGLNTGEPSSLLGYPVTINQDVANTATGNKAVLFGAFKKFKIRKVKGITLVRLNERYGELHQVAFLAFTRWDSKVLDAGTDPIKCITMA